ncbi:MAG: hypothetical protein C0448_11995 [Sphingobacteriaceae bacterium]|nr:hypothetical protein [Sphingobacteriaceae bacterium]
MNKTIYFPSFEPPTQSWLKFALLYMDNFNPIIPDRGLGNISQQYRDIINNTDLITPYNPQYLQGERASIKAIEFIERVKNNVNTHSSILNRPNLIRDFTNDINKEFFIYQEKFSMHWQDYCRENNFSENHDGGILVSEELGFIYMSFLAEEIAFDEEMSIITDNNKFDNFLNYKRSIPRATIARHSFAQGIMSLVVPKNISEISVSSLIDFRNNNRELIRSFNLELDNSLNNIQEAVTQKQFIERFNNIYSDLSREIIAQGIGFATIPLGTYLLIKNPLASTPEYIRDIMGGIGLLLTGRIAISGRWKEIVNQRNCKRYITNLERLR